MGMNDDDDDDEKQQLIELKSTWTDTFFRLARLHTYLSKVVYLNSLPEFH